MENGERMAQLRNDVIAISHRLYERHLVAGRGGNVSVRQGEGAVLITPHGASLGFVRTADLLEMSLEGKILSGKGRPSTETRLHLAIYRALPVQAIVHAHPLHATALTLRRKRLKPLTFETFFSLGEVRVIPQETPTVLETDAVVDALRVNNVVLLSKHGAVAIGESLQDAYFLTDLLEEAARMVVVAERDGSPPTPQPEDEAEASAHTDVTYRLFSNEHISAIAELINNDGEAKRRGQVTRLTTRLGIRLDETGQIYSIHLQDGQVVSIGYEDDVDFLISGPEIAWRHVFGGRIDPFVAVTQRRLKLRGDLGKLSRWYAPFYRIFELWKLAPVE